MRVENYDQVSQVSIVPREQSGGMTVFRPKDEGMEIMSKQYLLDKICVSMGGRIAEEVVNGPGNVTNAALSDIEMATRTAKLMVKEFGMSEAGPRTLNQESGPLLQKLVDDEIDHILR